MTAQPWAPAVLRGKAKPSAAHRGMAKVLSWLRPGRAALASVASVPLTTIGLACIDYGVFLASQVAGFIVTGISLILLEHVIADEA